MIAVTATACCLGCEWTAGPGGPAAVDRQAERHTKAGHPTATMATPVTAAAAGSAR